jgi:regulator of replication initiation timing
MTIVPLSDQEEAILELLMENQKLKQENDNLKEEMTRLKWALEEKD